jgi:FixJ family two-component response regulator
MIAIVDDDEAVRESTKSLVKSLGYNVRTFASAEEFLDTNLDDTSCLVLDVQMKGLSGVELQELLIAQARRTPIIFVTAFPDERTRNRAFDAGAIGFLSKPFSNEKLEKLLDLALANTITGISLLVTLSSNPVGRRHQLRALQRVQI